MKNLGKYDTLTYNARVAEQQTQQTQNLPIARSCGCNSHLGHNKEKTLERFFSLLLKGVAPEGWVGGDTWCTLRGGNYFLASEGNKDSQIIIAERRRKYALHIQNRGF